MNIPQDKAVVYISRLIELAKESKEGGFMNALAIPKRMEEFMEPNDDAEVHIIHSAFLNQKVDYEYMYLKPWKNA